MSKDIKNWNKIKGNQETRAKRGCTVTVDHDRVNAIFAQYETQPNLSNPYLSAKTKKV